MAKRNEVPISTGTHNVLATGTTIKGDIIAEENFRIDGVLEGTIKCKGKIVLGPQSIITGNIECLNIEVLGAVNGDIKCTDTLILRSTTKMNGNMTVKTLQIEPGAQFNGSSSMLQMGGILLSKDKD